MTKNWRGRAGVELPAVRPAVVSAPGVSAPVAVAVDAALVRGAIAGAAGTIRDWGRALGAMAVVPRLADGRVHAVAMAPVATPIVAPAVNRPHRVAIAARPAIARARPAAARVSRGLELSDLPVLPVPVARPYYGNADEGATPVITRGSAFMGLPDSLGAVSPTEAAITAAGH